MSFVVSISRRACWLSYVVVCTSIISRISFIILIKVNWLETHLPNILRQIDLPLHLVVDSRYHLWYCHWWCLSWKKKYVRQVLFFFTVIRFCLFSANTHLFSCLLLWELNGAWRPNEIGRKEIRAEVTHITKIEMGTDLRVSHSVYCNGSLMWMYLKKDTYYVSIPLWSLQKKFI